MREPLLNVRNVTKSFGGVKALDGVGLTLRAGEIHALMGENGAGKSTLIKVLTGVYTPDDGAMEFGGKVIAPRSTREAEAAGISTVYQEVNLVPTLSIADNILLGRQPTRFGFLDKKAIKQRAEAALSRLGLKLDVSLPLSSCSMAQQQLVAIARALAGLNRSTVSPPTSIVPPSGWCAPVMTLMSVDLPAPFSPSNACTSPACKSNETPFNARTAPKAFVTPDNCSSAGFIRAGS